MTQERHTVQYVSKNTKGEDYICGDVHGCFSLLEQQLAQVEFDKTCDRLFVVGDLIDRGPENTKVLEYLGQPWFFSVIGNHEFMMLSALACTDECTRSTSQAIWYSNGGRWWEDCASYQQQDIFQRVSQLPVAIELQYQDRKIGIVHAEVSGSWTDFIDRLSDVGEEADEWDQDNTINIAVWSRSKANVFISHDQGHNVGPWINHLNPIRDIDHVFHGHTIVDHPITIGNTTLLDTGSFLQLTRNPQYKHATITVKPISTFL